MDAVVPWFFTAAGQVASPAFGKGIRLPLRLPDKCTVELALHCDRTPAFSLTLAADGASMAVEIHSRSETYLLIHPCFLPLWPESRTRLTGV